MAMSNIRVFPAQTVQPWRAEALMAMTRADLAQTLGDNDVTEWLEAATACGLVEAQLRLGRMLLTGEGLPRDWQAAFACFLSASADGNAEAQNLLGRCYENGWGVAPDRAAARACYREAAEKGDFRGAHNHACALAAEGCVAGALHWFAGLLAMHPNRHAGRCWKRWPPTPAAPSVPSPGANWIAPRLRGPADLHSLRMILSRERPWPSPIRL